MKMTERERAYVEVCARDMHPDLFEAIEESPAAQDLRKRFNMCDQVDHLRRLMSDDAWPQDNLSWSAPTYITCTVYNYDEKFKDTGYIDQPTSLREMRRVVQFLRRDGAKIEKQIDDNYLRIKATFDDGLVITVSVSRGAVCEKKVVGQEYVPPSKGYMRDIVEWDCKPVSILKSGDV